MNIVENVDFACDLLKQEKVLLMQTDTIFGLVCLGNSKTAMEKIIKIKNRKNPVFSFFVSDLEMAKKFANIDKKQEEIFTKAFPGHFTLIFQASYFALKTLPSSIFGTNENSKKTIGLRIPANNFCIETTKKVRFPLIATSANISGKESPKKLEDVDKSIISKVDGVYFDKTLKLTEKGSTIIDLSVEGQQKIIREGSGDISLLGF